METHRNENQPVDTSETNNQAARGCAEPDVRIGRFATTLFIDKKNPDRLQGEPAILAGKTANCRDVSAPAFSVQVNLLKKAATLLVRIARTCSVSGAINPSQMGEKAASPKPNAF